MAGILFFKFLPWFGKGNRNLKHEIENLTICLVNLLIDGFGQVGMSMGLCGEMERSRLQLKPATSPNLVLERYPIVQVATKWGKYFFYGFPSLPPYG